MATAKVKKRPRRSATASRLVPQITVSGFKSMAQPITIDVAPLTLLCGANSSGKSSIMQPLLLIKQTMEVAFDPGPLLLAGSNVGFSTAAEMFWHGRADVASSDRLSVGFRGSDGEFNELVFGPAEHGIDLLEMRYKRNADSKIVTFTAGKAPDDLSEAMGPEWVDIFKNRDWDLSVVRNRCFFDLVSGRLGGTTGGYGVFGPYPALRAISTNMLHLPGLRDNPARFYPATQVGNVFPGVFQTYVASVVQSWTDAKDPRLGELGKQLQQLGLTWKVATQRIDDTRVALRVGRLPKPRQGGSKDLVNIVDVGLGVSQTLPVLIALLTAQPGQYVFLEQPEIHLHPRAQVALADFLLDAALRDVRVITETHSYLILRAVQEAATRRGIPPETVGLNWFSRDPDGATSVDSTYLGTNGSFGEWPNDFADIEMDIEDRYMAAVIKAERSR